MLKDPVKIHRQRPQGRRPIENAVIKELLKIEASFKKNQQHTSDPIELVKKYADPKDQEVVGFIVALLAYGNVKQIKRSAEKALEFLGESPHKTLLKTDDRFWFKFFSSHEFKHRFTIKWDMAWIFFWLGAALRTSHSIENFFLSTNSRSSPGVSQNTWLFHKLSDFIDRFTNPNSKLLPTNGRSMRFLLSDPRKKSACKRLLLYLRWMTSPFYPDLHIWQKFPVENLIIPVDTHVLRISKNLGLTKSNQANWKASEEITSALRALSPENPPIRFDFPLCHFGISKACPSKRDEKICKICGMNSVCVTYAQAKNKRTV